MISDSALGDYAWSIQDEAQSQFVAMKYADRKRLRDDWTAKRKAADKAELIDGKPNPQYPRLRLEADLAQTRFDMAYLVGKNQMLEEQIGILHSLSARVSLLEGAYNYVRILADTAKSAYEQLTRKTTTGAKE